MDALARSDVDKLTSLSDLGTETPDEIRKKWQFATEVSAKHYNFGWQITGEMQADPTDGSVKLSIKRNITSPGTYDENYALPMHVVDGKWKVKVGEINSTMYPGLPRA